MQRQSLDVSFALGPIELAALERAWVRRIGDMRRALGRGDAWELRHLFHPSLANQLREVGVVIRKKVKRLRRREVLALKEHRRVGKKQKQRRERAISSGTGFLA